MKRIRMFTFLTVTAFALAACGGGGDGNGEDDGAAVSGDASAVHVEAGDLYFDPEQASASAGEIEVTLENVGEVEHNFVIEEEGDATVVEAGAGETASGTISLDAGTYTYYCSIPGHRTTMEGTLEVS